MSCVEVSEAQYVERIGGGQTFTHLALAHVTLLRGVPFDIKGLGGDYLAPAQVAAHGGIEPVPRAIFAHDLDQQTALGGEGGGWSGRERAAVSSG